MRNTMHRFRRIESEWCKETQPNHIDAKGKKEEEKRIEIEEEEEEEEQEDRNWNTYTRVHTKHFLCNTIQTQLIYSN